MYALYQHYGFEVGDIGRLFIAGFGSSMIFGTLVGSLADKQCGCPHACIPDCVMILLRSSNGVKWRPTPAKLAGSSSVCIDACPVQKHAHLTRIRRRLTRTFGLRAKSTAIRLSSKH